MEFVVEEFDGIVHLLDLLILVLLLNIIGVKLFDGLSELCVDSDKFFEGLFEHVILLLKFNYSFPELQQLILIGEVVLKLGHR